METHSLDSMHRLSTIPRSLSGILAPRNQLRIRVGQALLVSTNKIILDHNWLLMETLSQDNLGLHQINPLSLSGTLILEQSRQRANRQALLVLNKIITSDIRCIPLLPSQLRPLAAEIEETNNSIPRVMKAQMVKAPAKVEASLYSHLIPGIVSMRREVQ